MAEPTNPPARQERRKRPRPLWPLLWLALLVCASALLRLERSRRQGEVRRAGERYAALVEARPVEKTKAQRARFYKLHYYLNYPVAASHAVAGFIRRLEAVFGTRQMLGLRIDAGTQHFDFELTVAIAAADPGALPWRFARLFDELRDIPEVVQASFTEKEAQDNGRRRLFSIRGRAELLP